METTMTTTQRQRIETEVRKRFPHVKEISEVKGCGEFSYKMTTTEGVYIMGILSGADFPNEGFLKNRGEVFISHVVDIHNYSTRQLYLAVLYFMSKTGSNRVKFTVPNAREMSIINWLEDNGYIEFIQVSHRTGTKEYWILPKNNTEKGSIQ